jgi:hypothetical protein
VRTLSGLWTGQWEAIVSSEDVRSEDTEHSYGIAMGGGQI